MVSPGFGKILPSNIVVSLGDLSFMAKTPTKALELHPDAWLRFERAAGVVAKTPPQHRVAKNKKTATMKRRALKTKNKPV
jgi:hypothetical protein